jgi:small-conductance mechanosensitive channel
MLSIFNNSTTMSILIPVTTILVSLLIMQLFGRFYFGVVLKNIQYFNKNKTSYKFLGYFIKALIILIGFGLAIYSIEPLKGIATSMLAGAGIMAVAIGFASQQVLSNIISGIFIVTFKPFKINDRIIIRDKLVGIVDEITLRHTVIRNFENQRIILPNSIISNEIIINADLDDQKICRFIEFGISYESDIDLAKKIMSEEVRAHKDYYDNRTAEDIEKAVPEVTVRVIGLGDSSVNLRAWMWAENSATAFVMFCDLIESIKKRLDAEGIEIPYPHRTIVQKG